MPEPTLADLSDVDQLKAFLVEIQQKPQEVVVLLRKHDYVFRRAPSTAIQRLPELSDGERWEHLAFYLYTSLLELAEKAKNLLGVEEHS